MESAVQLKMALKPSGVCPCCGVPTECLVRHHWREIGKDDIIHEKEVCYTCNVLLQPRNFGMDGTHLLPCWDEQVRFARSFREKRQLKAEAPKRRAAIKYLDDLEFLRELLVRSPGEIYAFGMECRDLLQSRLRRLEGRESVLREMAS